MRESDKEASAKSNRSERHENLYAMLLDAIPSSVLLIDRDIRIVSANRNFLERSHRSLSNTIGHRLEEVFPAIILDNVDITSRIRQVFEENRPTRGERMTYRAPGVPRRIYYYRIHPFAWKGVVESTMLLMDDVTDQVRLGEEVRKVERHLASVVSSASDIVLSTDINGRILTWNPEAEKVSGYTLEEMQGRFFFECCAENHRKKVKQGLSSMRTGGGSQMAEWDLITKDGNGIQVSWVCSPMKNDQSQAVGIVAVGRDLTERRKLEAQLLQSQKLAALGVMAGGIAHEIRNPLAICSSAAQFLMDDGITLKLRKECAEKIHAGIQRASLIIENLLSFARPSSKTEMEVVDIPSLLEKTLTLVASQARVQTIDLVPHFPDASVLTRGRSSLLQQVFLNLFLNAINAMPDGGVLSLSVERTDGRVMIRFADTGHGISRVEMDKVFDPFYTTSPVGKGTGLGLSICFSIVRQHLGSIEIDSIEGKGSTFTVNLPTI